MAAVIRSYTATVAFTDLPEAPGSKPQSTFPRAINASGQIVGDYVDPCFCKAHGFLYENGVYTTIDEPGSYVTALTGINDSGVIAGIGTGSGCWGCGIVHAFTLQGGVFSPISVPISGAQTYYSGVNNAGDMSGTYIADGTYHVYMLSAGAFTNLDFPGARATLVWGQGINSGKRVVGSYDDASGVTHGFLAFPTYNVCLLYDSTKSVKSGATLPVKLELCDDNGADLSSSSITLHATNITQVSTSASLVVEDSGDANPDNDFRFDSTLGASGGYIFNLSTKGLSTGTYILNFTAGGDSHLYAAPFQVR